MRWARFNAKRPALAAAACGLSALGFGSGCSTEELQAAMAGLDAAGRILGNLNESQSANEDISFGDWLADELKN
jgi:hypothetical protein